MVISQSLIITRLSQIHDFLPKGNMFMFTAYLCMSETTQSVACLKYVCFVFQICKKFKSHARSCLYRTNTIFNPLCMQNMYINVHGSAKCSFYEEFLHNCHSSNHWLLSKLREITSCRKCSNFVQHTSFRGQLILLWIKY